MATGEKSKYLTFNDIQISATYVRSTKERLMGEYSSEEVNTAVKR